MMRAAMSAVRSGTRSLTRNPVATLVVLVALAAVGYALFLRSRRTPRAIRECMDCSESWANCPAGSPYCYWGDKTYNKGKCCKAPWSSDCKTPAKGSGAKITLYKDADYGSDSVTYRVGDYPDLGSMSDEVSSVKVPSNLKVVLYQKSNFEGKTLTLPGGDYPNLKHYKFSSYDNGKFYGYDVCGDESNTECWNDTATSMRVMSA